MDQNTARVLLFAALGHTTLLLTLAVKFWAFAKNHAIAEYQHQLMWAQFLENSLHKQHKERTTQEP